MRESLGLWLRSLVSDRALTALYDRRRALFPTEDNRTALTVSTCGILLTIILTFLVAITLTRQDTESYVHGRNLFVFPDAAKATWMISPLAVKACKSGDECYASARKAAEAGFSALNLSGHAAAFPPGLGLTDYAVGLVRLELLRSAWDTLASQPTVLLSLPRFTFRRADVYVDGEHRGTFHDNDRVTVTFDPKQVPHLAMRVDVVLELMSADGDVVRGDAIGTGESEGLFLTTLPEFHAYQDFLGASRAGRGNWPGQVARIVMALFVIVLFLFVDGSPEALGLSLFLGFEAIALMLNFQAFPIRDDNFLRHYLSQMGDVMRLYFYLQLARMIDKRVWPWLLWGSVLSVPYGLLREYGGTYAWEWLINIPRTRDLVIGSIGVLVTTRAAYHLRDKDLPYRVAALCVAAVACFEQLCDPLVWFVPFLKASATFTTVRDFLHPTAAYLFAISAYINVSTLESRVKLLSKAQAEARQADLVQRTRSGVLERFLARTVVNRLSEAAGSETSLRRALAPRRVYAALVRAELQGYAELTRDLDMEELAGVLGNLYRRTLEEGREVAQLKPAGDALFLFVEETGGFGEASATDVALGLAQQLAKDAEALGLSLGIGVHYGEVVAGNLAGERFVDYAAAGPNVAHAQTLARQAASPAVRDTYGRNAVVISLKAVTSLRRLAPGAGSDGGMTQAGDVYVLPAGERAPSRAA